MADKVEIELEPKVTSKAMADIKNQLTGVMDAAAGATKAREPLKTGAEVASKLSAATGSPGSAMALAGPSGAALGTIFDTITKFVEAANPAVVEQLMMAFEDIQGVIGQALTPVLAAVTPLIRMFGNVLASIIPVSLIEKVTGMLEPVIGVIETIAELLVDTFNMLLEPIFSVTEIMISAFMPALEAVAAGISAVVKAINALPAWVLNRLGLGSAGGSDGKGLKSSVGAAGKGAQRVGVQELGSHLATQAYGMVASNKPEAKTADMCESINEAVKAILAKMGIAPVSPKFSGNR